jgi:hypothetical protein
MPIISFTAADALSGVLLEAGKYPAEIIGIDGPRRSNSQKSVSFFTTFRITTGQFSGKELRVAYNTETSSSGLLGDLQFSPASDFLKIEAAIKQARVEVKERPNFDTDELLHKPLTLIVGVAPKPDGGLGQFINGYLPPMPADQTGNISDGSIPF